MIKLFLCGLLFTTILLPTSDIETSQCPEESTIENNEEYFDDDTCEDEDSDINFYDIICPSGGCWS